MSMVLTHLSTRLIYFLQKFFIKNFKLTARAEGTFSCEHDGLLSCPDIIFSLFAERRRQMSGVALSQALVEVKRNRWLTSAVSCLATGASVCLSPEVVGGADTFISLVWQTVDSDEDWAPNK
jgi:hypothetical protein